MALSRKISKATFDALPDALKAEYKLEDGTENYFLDIAGGDDISALIRGKDRESADRKKAEADLKKTTEEFEAYKKSSNHADIATLDKSWKDKFDKSTKESSEKIAKLEGNIKKSLVDNVAMKLATELAPGAANLILPHIKSRLAADFEGDEPTTRILDTNGKISASSLDDLKNEFIANKDFSSIIKTNKASGGAPSGNKHSSFGGANTQNDKPVDLSQLSGKDLAAHIMAKKEAESNQ